MKGVVFLSAMLSCQAMEFELQEHQDELGIYRMEYSKSSQIQEGVCIKEELSRKKNKIVTINLEKTYRQTRLGALYVYGGAFYSALCMPVTCTFTSDDLIEYLIIISDIRVDEEGENMEELSKKLINGLKKKNIKTIKVEAPSFDDVCYRYNRELNEVLVDIRKNGVSFNFPLN